MKVIYAVILVTICLLTSALADTVPQRPEQIEFNKHVISGSVLVVANGVGNVASGLMAPFCKTISSIQEIWGQNESDNPNCSFLWSGSKIKIMMITNAYTIDDPSQPVTPFGNDAHLIVKVEVLTASPLIGYDTKALIGKLGYMMIDDLVWPSQYTPPKY